MIVSLCETSLWTAASLGNTASFTCSGFEQIRWIWEQSCQLKSTENRSKTQSRGQKKRTKHEGLPSQNPRSTAEKYDCDAWCARLQWQRCKFTKSMSREVRPYFCLSVEHPHTVRSACPWRKVALGTSRGAGKSLFCRKAQEALNGIFHRNSQFAVLFLRQFRREGESAV